MKKYFLLALPVLLSATIFLSCQMHPKAGKRPKLVVGIVVDQMRWDYLYRFNSKFGPNGFKRLMREGYSCANTHINYLPTVTGPGHACVYTGSVPAIHGIAGNGWYDRLRNKRINCIEDTTVTLVGNGTPKDKDASPRNLLVTTVTDELKLATSNHSKVIALALKDRSAILPGGHNPNGAYFMDGTTGAFITTTYYANSLPAWVDSFNNKKLPQKYLAQNWNTLLPLDKYTESTADDEPWENNLNGEEKPVFPHQTAELAKKDIDVIAFTPAGNTLTLDFAHAAVEGEKLGASNYTDFLAISLSAPDLIGHTFGPNSVEEEDCYLRLDQDLANFFSYLDSKFGKENYLVFLTADHGVAQAPGFMKQEKMPAGSFKIDTALALLNAEFEEKWGKGNWFPFHENMQLYLNYDLMAAKKVSREEAFKLTHEFFMQYNAVLNVVDLQHLNETTLQPDLKDLLANGYNAQRSGDFQIIYDSGWFEGFGKGTTHANPYNYDTHIPLLWMGWHIKHGEDHHDVHMTDIAPTLSALLHIQEPSGSVGKVLAPIVAR